MTGYAVIIDGEGGSFSAFAPDLPGCVASGTSAQDVGQLIGDAIRLHIRACELTGSYAASMESGRLALVAGTEGT
jgi:predicted RNase H-like HicB family nuclease